MDICLDGLRSLMTWWETFRTVLDVLLVGGWATPLKNMKVSWDDYSQLNEWENKIDVPNHQPDSI